MPRLVRQQATPPQCRFCLETAATLKNPFIAPCICDGSVKWIHTACLKRWARMDPEHNATLCSICHTPFQIPILPDLEWIPSTHDLTVNILSNYTLLSIGFQYFLLALTMHATPPPINIPRQIQLAIFCANLILQPAYALLFASRWRVQRPLLYLQTALTRTPRYSLTSSLHIILLVSHFYTQDPFAGFAISLLMNAYWRGHVLTLHDMNRMIE